MIADKNLTELLDLPQSRVVGWTTVEASICFQIEFTNTAINCPHCQALTSELNQNRPILIRDLSVFGKPVYLRVPRRQFYCRQCQRYVTERLTWLDWRRRHTQRYEANICDRIKGASIEKVAREEGLSFDEVEGMFKSMSEAQVKKNGNQSAASVSMK